MFGKFDTFGINRRNRTISLKSHTDCLGQAVHAVCGIHTGTGTTRRTGMAYKIVDFFFCHFACCMCTDCLKHTGKTGFLSLYMTGKHRTAADKYGRYIDSGCRHQKSRYVFVTVWHHNEGVKRMGKCHTFGRIRDQVTGNKRIFHSDMSHRNPVAYSNRRKYDRCSAGHRYAEFYCLYNLINIHMTRDDFIVRTDDTNKRFFEFLFCHTQCVKQRTLRCCLHPLFH